MLTTIQIFDQSTITFKLPFLPAIFEPITANIIDGSIAMAERIDESDIEPTIIPKSIVDTTDAEPIVCASLSLPAARI